MTRSLEEQLAYLGFQLIDPGAALRPYVRSFWHFRQALPPGTLHEEFMHPTGGFGLVFNFGDAPLLHAQAQQTPVFLDGTNTVTRGLGFRGQVDLFGIRFREGGAWPFLALPLIEAQNETAALDLLPGPALPDLHGRLSELATPQARADLIEGWLLARLARSRTPHPLIAPTLARLQSQAEPGRIEALAREFAISARQLERLYREQVGMTPRQYARLQRVERARLALRQRPDLEGGQLAQDLGYFDQAHFIHDFRAVVGLSPGAYARRQRDKGSGR